MAIPVIIMATMAAISVAKGASDKKKARDKYYLTAQSELYQQRQSALTQTDAERSDLSKRLIAYCKESIADFKCPRTVDFREELPRHPTGKLYKRLLKDEYWAKSGRSI